MKAEFTEMTELGISKMNFEYSINSVFNSASLRLGGGKSRNDS
jgi:hypothetical protein